MVQVPQGRRQASAGITRNSPAGAEYIASIRPLIAPPSQSHERDQEPVPGSDLQMSAIKSKYSSSSFLPPWPFSKVLWVSMNSIDLIHLTIL